VKRTPLRRKSTKQRIVDKTRTRQVYTPPAWFMAITPGSHGSTPYQKRYWRVVSEYVRKRDFEKYGTCVSCGFHFERWQDSQAGHWLPYAVCNAWYKFDSEFNIAGQCSGCNRSLHRSGAHVGHAMGEELKRRHGDGVLERIKHDNELYRGQKLEVPEMVAKAALLYATH
jgi:hypothetical protein